MNRRELISLIGGVGAAWPLASRAQEPSRVRRVGVLLALVDSDPEGQPRIAAFQRELENLGWTDGRNIQIEYRWASGDAERFRVLAAELVATRPDVLVAHATPSAEALARETRTIPIIFVLVTDPVERGFAASLAEPGGNVTGFTIFEPSMGAKWVEFLKELSPRLARVGLLLNPATAPGRGTTYFPSIEAAARSFGIDPIRAAVSDAAQIEDAIATFSRRPDSGLIIVPDIFMMNHRELITALARRHALPAVYPFRYFAEAGGLISYGIDAPDLFRRAANYVNQVLRGAKPSSLPIQQPDKFELVINMKTAKSLGLNVPRILLVRANEVIE
jgi:putative tryptophan/tyrosine transport system substrate-binding protein